MKNRINALSRTRWFVTGLAPFANYAIIPVALSLAAMSQAYAATTTTTTLAPLPTVVSVGSGVTLTATVVRSPKAALTGPVTFRDKGVVIKTTNVASNATASYTVPAYTTSGAHSYTATYNDANNVLYAPKSTSAAAALTAKYATTTVLSSSSPTAKLGQTITLTAKVTGGTPTGTVTFTDNGTAWKTTPTVSNGVASLPVTFTTTGSHTLSASYLGDNTTQPSVSSALAEPVTTAATDYYFDAAGNSTTGNGTQAAPWVSLSKLATVKLGADDRVLLKCGSLWREQLNLDASNVAVAGTRIVVAGWGSTCTTQRPVINAAVQLTGRWIHDANETRSTSIYQYKFNAGELPGPIRQLFTTVNGQIMPLQEARYPDAGYAPIANDTTLATVSEAGKINYVSTYLKTAAADNTYFETFITTAPDGSKSDPLKGATVHVRSAQYRVEDFTVGSYVGPATPPGEGQINFGLSPYPFSDADSRAYSGLPIKKDFGYVLTGKDWMISAPGEWNYDASKNLLTLWVPAGLDPTKMVIEATVRDHGVAVTSVTASISDVAVRYAAKEGIAVDSSPSSVLNNVDIAYSGRHGIGVDANNRPSQTKIPSTGIQINKSKIAYSRLNGILTYYVAKAQITDNTVTDSGTYLEPRHSDCGICVEGGGQALITGNTVQRSAYIGIRYPNFNNSQVLSNTVIDACALLDDCGGIYTVTGDTGVVTNPGSKIDGNLVRGLTGGNLSGTPAKRHVAVAGIYLDDSSQHVLASKNIVADTQLGVYLHSTADVNLQGNAIAGASKSCFVISNDTLAASQLSITDNSCVAGGAVYGLSTYTTDEAALEAPMQNPAAAISLSSKIQALNPSANAIEFARNRYTSLYGPTYFHVEDPKGLYSADNDTPFHLGMRRLDLSTWATLFTLDNLPAGDSAVPFLSLYRAQTTGNSLMPNGDFSLTKDNGKFVAGWDQTSSVIPLDAAKCGSTSPCAGRVPGDQKPKSTSEPFVMADGGTYLLKISLRTPDGPDNVQAIVGMHCDGNWGLSAGYSGLLYTRNAGWNTLEVPFTASGLSRCDSHATRLDLHPADVPRSMLFDDVSIQPATVQLNTALNDYRVLDNPSTADVKKACPDSDATRCSQYVDLKGVPVQWPLSVPAQGTAVVVWTRSAFYNASPAR